MANKVYFVMVYDSRYTEGREYQDIVAAYLSEEDANEAVKYLTMNDRDCLLDEDEMGVLQFSDEYWYGVCSFELENGFDKESLNAYLTKFGLKGE